MSDPMARQAATLAALDRLIEAVTNSGVVALAMGSPDRSEEKRRTVLGLSGRRSILVRHAARKASPGDTEAYCDRCSYYLPTVWPCGDWRDAAAGLEVPGEAF